MTQHLRPRVAVVGPTFPLRGGIAQHTTELAHRLARRTEVTELASWQAQGPTPLTRHSPLLESPESTPFPRTSRDLHWRSPTSWSKVGRRLGTQADALILIMTTPLQLPALSLIARRFRTSSARSTARVLMIAHNVLPHESHPGSSWAARRVLRVADHVIVHSGAQRAEAERLGAEKVSVAALPLHGPKRASTRLTHLPQTPNDHVAFFGFIRPYKGLDDLLTALSFARAQPTLTVAGEFWEPVQHYQRRVEELGLAGRVRLRPGYLSADDVSELLARSDALILPYRSATGSQMPRLAFTHGVPVLTTDVGDLAEQVQHDVDGLVSAANDPVALAQSIDALYSGNTWRRLRSCVQEPSVELGWSDYLDEVLARTGR